ncbi:MAG: hypothetical protein ACTHLA_05155 [Asticcacaulis sp.]|jgi:hypothetical protein|uniref:hypothetical protein n=1 Tax=Asticcacaulis sp. TaxID=1872648 RepID=UPI003F7C06DF
MTRDKLKTYAKYAAYASLGPITGPCVAGIVRHREKDPILAGMYGVLLVLIWVQLPAWTAHAIEALQHMQALR